MIMTERFAKIFWCFSCAIKNHNQGWERESNSRGDWAWNDEGFLTLKAFHEFQELLSRIVASSHFADNRDILQLMTRTVAVTHQISSRSRLHREMTPNNEAKSGEKLIIKHTKRLKHSTSFLTENSLFLDSINCCCNAAAGSLIRNEIWVAIFPFVFALPLFRLVNNHFFAAWDNTISLSPKEILSRAKWRSKNPNKNKYLSTHARNKNILDNVLEDSYAKKSFERRKGKNERMKEATKKLLAVKWISVSLCSWYLILSHMLSHWSGG